MSRLKNFSLIFVVCFFPLFSHELTVVSMFKNEALYLEEWIEYHHMVGVDHFCLYDNDSTDNWEEVLKSYIDQGIVEVIPWSSNVHGPFVSAQLVAFADGIRNE